MSKKNKELPFDLDAHWKTNFNYPYLGSHDFDQFKTNGKDAIITVKRFYRKEVESANGTEICNVVEFVENCKDMIVNKENFANLQQAYRTPNGRGLLGKRVYLYVKNGVQSFGKKVDALRFRAIPVKEKPAIKQSEARKAAEYYLENGHFEQWESVRLISPETKQKLIELSKTLNDAEKEL